MPERFVARNSKARLALLFVGALAFVVAGAWVVGLFGPPPRPDRIWVGWACMLFFGLCAGFAVPRFFEDGDEIVIDANGLFWRRRSPATIPWSAVRGWRVGQVRNQRFICIGLRDPSQFPPTGIGALLGGLNRNMGFGDVTLSATGTDKSFDQMLFAMEQWAPPPGPGA